MILGRAVSLLADGRWHFGIGDPNVMAWVTVVAYAIASVLTVGALLTSRNAQRALATADPVESSKQKSLKRFWFLATVVLVFLGINKQLDLQSLFTQFLRDRAVANGWYDNRREYQLDFIVGITLIGMVATLAIAIGLRKVLHRVLGGVLGLSMLVVFVVIRASSFHYVDVLIYRGTIHLNWVLELGGIAIVGGSAMLFVLKTRRQLPARLAAARSQREAAPQSDPSQFAPPALADDSIETVPPINPQRL